MSQKAALAALDTSIHAAFAGAGLADSGLYTAPGGETAVACRVYVDRDVQLRGEFGQIVGKRTEVAYLRADVTPVRGGTLVVDGDTFVNVEPIEGSDGSIDRWLVRHV